MVNLNVTQSITCTIWVDSHISIFPAAPLLGTLQNTETDTVLAKYTANLNNKQGLEK